MLIRVRFFGDLKEYMKKSWMTIDVPQGSSLHNFIVELVKNGNPELLEKLMENGKKVPSKIKILVNGRDIKHLEGLETEIKDRDLISILPIAGGG
jgi:molybdopterin synthase sulfur carrier subunit